MVAGCLTQMSKAQTTHHVLFTAVLPLLIHADILIARGCFGCYSAHGTAFMWSPIIQCTKCVPNFRHQMPHIPDLSEIVFIFYSVPFYFLQGLLPRVGCVGASRHLARPGVFLHSSESSRKFWWWSRQNRTSYHSGICWDSCYDSNCYNC